MRRVLILGVVLVGLLASTMAWAGPLDVPYDASTFNADITRLRKAGHLSRTDFSALFFHELRLKRKGGVPAGWTLAVLLADQKRLMARQQQLERDQERLRPTALKVRLTRLERAASGVAFTVEIENTTKYEVIVYRVEMDVLGRDGKKLIGLAFGSSKGLKPGQRESRGQRVELPAALAGRFTSVRLTDVKSVTRVTRLVLGLTE